MPERLGEEHESNQGSSHGYHGNEWLLSLFIMRFPGVLALVLISLGFLSTCSR